MINQIQSESQQLDQSDVKSTRSDRISIIDSQASSSGHLYDKYDLINSHILEEESPLDESETVQPQKEQINLQESEKVEPVIERVRKSLYTKSTKKKIQGLNDNEIEHGEEQFMRLQKLKCELQPSLKLPSLEGDLVMTNFKIVFKYYSPIYIASPFGGPQVNLQLPSFIDEYLRIPLNMIHKIDKSTTETKKSALGVGVSSGVPIQKQFFLEITTKDFRILKLQFDSTDECNNALLRINMLAFPENEMHDIFAFSYFYPTEDLDSEYLINGWDIYKNPEDEFRRQGINFEQMKQFQIFINQDYAISPTYPRVHVIPSKIREQNLAQCAKFRTKQRFPSMTFYDKVTGCSIWRSSQTMTGILTNRSADDELMLQEIGKTNVINNNSRVVIYDARSYINAMANRINKGGFENTKECYTNCEIQFCDIDNIHAVRDAITKMYEIGLSNTQAFTNISKWLTALDNAGWLQIASKALQATNNILETIRVKKCNVHVHCTDGWDRTAQLCGLAQMMLDPYYRTIKGFQILIEKDWLSFGHMFQRRLGHYNKNFKDDQRCPIFIQFLDLVYQVLHQFPDQFEFNRQMLSFIAQEIYSCKFGTFLCNSERERVKYNLRQKTVSMWTYINHYADRFRNTFYQASNQQSITHIPVTQYYDLQVWRELFFKYVDFNQSTQPGQYISPDDHRDQIMRDQKVLNLNLKRLLEHGSSLLQRLQTQLNAEKEQKNAKEDAEYDIIRRSEAVIEKQQKQEEESPVNKVIEQISETVIKDDFL